MNVIVFVGIMALAFGADRFWNHIMFGNRKKFSSQEKKVRKPLSWSQLCELDAEFLKMYAND